MITLRPYQEEAIAALHASSARTQLVALPTGTGKTVVFSELVRRRGGTALILAHRDELLTQAAAKLRTVAPELAMTIGVVQGPQDDTHAPVVLASVQTLAGQTRLPRLPTEFTTVIVDEAHHATAQTYRRILDHVNASPLVVGFTATPERHDKSQLREVFSELAYARSLEEMIREGYLCDLRALRITLDQLDLRKVKKSRGDFQAEDLGRALEEAHAVEHTVAAYQQHAAGRRTVAFFPTVALAHEAAEHFQAAGITAAAVDGTTDRDVRRQILADLSTGTTDVVCNVGVLTEGFDEPTLECILIAAPTRSRIKYAQMVGRGTRLSPGKSDCLILDLAGVSDDLTLQSVGLLFNLRKPPKPKETLTEARDREVAEDEAAAAKTAEQRAKARERRKVAAAKRDLFTRDRIQWVRVGERWILGLKDDLVVLDPQDDHWRVLLMGANRARVVARNLDLGYAQGAAEHLVREGGAVGLADSAASWRSLPASDGQRRMLLRLGVRPADELLKGEASDLITEAIAVERLARFDRRTNV